MHEMMAFRRITSFGTDDAEVIASNQVFMQ